MKRFAKKYSVFCLAVGALSVATSAVTMLIVLLPTTMINAAEPSDRGIAVVELFTSQGCSSCPPADAVMRLLVEKNAIKDLPVFCLSFHVDYWNRLGWKDPYSDALFSQRQRAYARELHSDQVYTPQMIVNGRVGFVGSKADLAKQAISEALSQPAISVIKLDVKMDADRRSLNAKYEVAGHADDEWINIAIVEREASNAVLHGENGGRTLAHANVVREFRAIQLDRAGCGEVSIDLPDGIAVQKLSVIAYTQRRSTLQITGAIQVATDQTTKTSSPSATTDSAKPPWNDFRKPSDQELKQKLTDIQYKVTQQSGTETAFRNAYWDNKEAGIYVDIVSGEPLFSSNEMFKSGTGWPSFVRPLDSKFITLKEDNTLFTSRTEVRSKIADSHVGHVFNDGPADRGGKRWCMNSAAMKFIPKEKMEAEGYSDYVSRVEPKKK